MDTVLIAGNPNAGKTTLFNQLAGTRAKTGNYPGVTVDRTTARVELGGREVELIDVPGTYSLSARSPEEQIAVDAILGEPPAAVVVVVDASSLERSLYLAQQILEAGVPLVVGLNMMDEARDAGWEIDSAGIGETLGAKVVELVASRGEGLEALGAAVSEVLESPPEPPEELGFGDEVEEAIEALLPVVGTTYGTEGRVARSRATWALLSLSEDDELAVPAELREAVDSAREGRDLEASIVGARYRRLQSVVSAHVRRAGDDRGTRARTARIDAVLVHPLWGMLVFAGVMYVVFEALFSWSDPAIGAIEGLVEWAQGAARGGLPEGPFADLIVEGVIAGVGNVIVFVPQIALLFLLIATLEDCGYLARVAFVIDRLMKGVGLSGKAFVPLLSGFACAIPAVMATRTIASRRDRLVTMLALPLMSCSARLPVYVLVTAVVFAGAERIGGVLSVGAVVLFSMYFLSVAATLAAAAVMRRTVLKGPRPTLVLELPPYRAPLIRNLLRTTWTRVKSFLVDAGTVILALTIVLWALLTYPKSDEVIAEHEEQRVSARAELEGDALEERLARIEQHESARLLEESAAGKLGHAIEPVLEPLGMDWRLGIGIIGAFAAREVFVSTLGIVFGVGDEVDEESGTLREELQGAERADGSKLMTPLTGVALMVFFVLACQCMSTIAVVKRESGTWRWPIFMFSYMTVLAYVAALGVYQVGAALGWGTG